MILVDTSVWINYLNGNDSREVDALDRALDAGVAAIGDVIFLGIIQGFRNDKEYKNTKAQLLKLDQYELFGLYRVEKCASNYRQLRKTGITIRSTTDVIIATFCIENKIPLLFSDRDFLSFVEHLKLHSATPNT